MGKVAFPHRLVAALGLFTLLAVIGCGGSSGDGGNGSTNSTYKFNADTLGCNDSLDITLTNSSDSFPANPTVTFESQGTNGSFDGSAVPIENGKTLVCGFPSNAPIGGYNVILNGQKIGIVDNTCRPN